MGRRTGISSMTADGFTGGGSAERTSPPDWSRSPLVLLVEDDREMREMLATVLRREGCRVIETLNGEEAVAWLGSGALEGELTRIPTLIVSDICLPHVSGLEILAGVNRAAHRIPVILITGFGDEETHARAQDLGAERVLDKPFSIGEFRTAVAHALRAHARLRPLAGDGHVV
jgi:DNA-binding response OmpR family regulator